MRSGNEYMNVVSFWNLNATWEYRNIGGLIMDFSQLFYHIIPHSIENCRFWEQMVDISLIEVRREEGKIPLPK